MKKTFIFLFIASIFISNRIEAQNNCPLNISVTTEEGSCYNNCLININLVNEVGVAIDSSATDLSDFKYFCINTSNWDTTYSFLNSFMVAPGTYKVGVLAICYYSTSSDSMYIRMVKDTIVTTTTSYITPIIGMLNHNALDSNDHGTVHSLSCVNTGRVQLKITGGNFPYYVKICDEFDTPIDTLVFNNRMYNGVDELKYNYKDYYSINNLSPGKYNFYVWDGCGYFMPKMWQTIETTYLPRLENLCWYYHSGNGNDHNVVKVEAIVHSSDPYYSPFVSHLIEYRFIHPVIAGNTDTTSWKNLRSGYYAGSGTFYFTIYDTVKHANKYCDFYGQNITFEARNVVCEEFPYTNSYIYDKPNPGKFQLKVPFHGDSSKVEPLQYDSCGYISEKTTLYGHIEYGVQYQFPVSDYTTCHDYNDYKNHHYTQPLIWTYTDNNTNQLIKRDTIQNINDFSIITGDEVEALYGSFVNSPVTINARVVLTDINGCELYQKTGELKYEKIQKTNGGSWQERYFELKADNSPDQCCTNDRIIILNERRSIPLSYNGDSCSVELFESPWGNSFNFIGKYNQATKEWTFLKEQASNPFYVNNTSNQKISIEISSPCLPSGKYSFRVNTSCSTYVYNFIANFNDNYETTVQDEPSYEINLSCSDLEIKPVAGQYTLQRHNTYTDTLNPALLNQPYTLTESLEARFKIFSGPTGGFTTDEVPLHGSLRLTIPGTYIIGMKPIDTSYCYSDIIYDTVVFSGKAVEYDYTYAYVCDTSSTTGFVRVKGKHGVKPYTYTLFSEANMAGTILEENSTGIFDDIPLRSNQQISVKIIDNCATGFYVNLFVLDMQSINKCWFSGGTQVTELCEGSDITVYAIGNENFLSYEWSGPNGFHAYSKDANVFIPREAESGYYAVTIRNSGCSGILTDSIFINVNRAAKVEITGDTHICSGKEAQIAFNTSGTGNVHYTIGHEENGVISYLYFTNNNSYTHHPSSAGKFWVHEVSDDLCTFSIPEDTLLYMTVVGDSIPSIHTLLPDFTDLGCNPTHIPNLTPSDFTVKDKDNTAAVVTLNVTDSVKGCLHSKIWTASYEDLCGNTADTVTITYVWKEDTEKPIITSSSTGGYFGCNPDTIITPTFIVTDNCEGNFTLPTDSVSDSGILIFDCDRWQTYRANYTDACGNKAKTEVIYYSWKESTEKSILVLNIDSVINLGCNPVMIPEPNPYFDIYVQDPCSPIVASAGTKKHESKESTRIVVVNVPMLWEGEVQENGCERIKIWTATYKNECGIESDTVTITYIWTVDTIKPVISTVAASADLGVNPIIIAPDFSVKDSCKGTFSLPIDSITVNGPTNSDCNYTQSWTAHYTDDCGNKADDITITYTWRLAISSDTVYKDTLCASALPYTISDTTFGIGTVSGHYTLHRQTLNGCDSIIHIWLTINEVSVTVTSVTNAVCGDDGSITLSATGKAPFEYSLDGITFQSSNIFTGLAGGTYTVTVRDANTCTATATAVVESSSAPDLSISCPPDINDTLAYGDCVMKIYPHQLGTPSVTHSLNWPFTISNDIPADSLYHEGDNLVTWIVTDDICGYADTCYQHIIIVFPQCPDAVDFEGNIYHGVRIGCDCWTQRNLESQKYSDGTDIPCVYEYVSHEHPNVTENVSRYGRLYCYEAAVRDSADNGHRHIQGICPEGWYLPTPEKYNELNTYGTDALRSPLYWLSGGGSNTTGFSALPAGFYNGATNRYEGLLGETYFWSVAGVGTNTSIIAYSIILDCDILLETQPRKGMGYSVRCIKEKN